MTHLSAEQLRKEWQTNPRWQGVERAYQGRRRRAPARHGPRRALARAAGRGEAVALHAGEAVRQRARRADRQPGDAAGEGRPRRDLSLGLAGRRRCEPRRRDVSGPVAVSRELRAVRRSPHQQHAGARGSDSSRRGRRLDRLAEADRRRRRSGLRRRAERVRADEEHDRSRCGRRALRGSAVVGEKVRSHGRQGAGADFGSDRQARRSAPRGRYLRRSHRARCAYRCGVGEPADVRRRRARPAVHQLEGAHQRRLLLRERRASTRRSRAVSPTRRTQI